MSRIPFQQMSKPYIIIRATTIEALEAAVGGHIAAGYTPQGGPFNASPFAPPHNTIAQAMVQSEDAPANSHELKSPALRRKEEAKARR